MISVIIPAKDAAKTLPDCLCGVISQTGYEFNKDFEVIVVDDGSKDDSSEIAKRFGVKVIYQNNTGPAAARNAGANAASGEILAFTDADCVPTPNWLALLCKPFKNPEIVGVKGTYLTKQTTIVPRFVQLEYESKYQRMAKLAKIDFIDTYSAAYRKKVFQDNGGFDEHFPAPSVEDQELSFRLANKGYTMIFVPEASVYHQHDSNLKEYFHRKYYIGYWKASMLRWLPEKMFKDSHTPPSQRWQIGLLALAILDLLLLYLFPGFAWGFLFFIGAFCLTAVNFLTFIFKRDRLIFLPAFVLIIIRAAALGLGLLAGFLISPKASHTQKLTLNMGQRLIKRFIDIVLSTMGIILFSPFFPIIALAIKLDSPGSIFFTQERAGEHGKPFCLIKFRTMVQNAEQLLDTLVDIDALSEPAFKIHKDPRVTRVGRILRRWSIDEIPQLWNILHGEMSFVGPRPEELKIVVCYNDKQRQRLAFKPGLTGPMQVSGRGDLNFNARLELELDYIYNYSLFKDLRILFKTIPVVISGRGAF
jgi:lipopolysaccharide/colanic/teichoic acid biosynthesis glycosyltransferase/GT2 family glycosyltransferase